MKCNNCGREIKENETFYMLDYSTYCEDCVEECICFCIGKRIYEEDEVEEYSSKELAIKEIEETIISCSKKIEDFKNNPNLSNFVTVAEVRRKELTDKLNFLKGE